MIKLHFFQVADVGRGVYIKQTVTAASKQMSLVNPKTSTPFRIIIKHSFPTRDNPGTVTHHYIASCSIVQPFQNTCHFGFLTYIISFIVFVDIIDI
jgi:hypothetical protein